VSSGDNIDELKARIAQLEQQNSDLEIALLTANEHGDMIDAQLSEANDQLLSEIQDRKKIEQALQLLVDKFSLEKRDLEIMVETLASHGDDVESQWWERINQAEEDAGQDPLTGLANRRRMDEFLSAEWRRHIDSGLTISLVMCDIDHFKLYNDHFGHIAGDKAIQTVASILKRASRASDLVTRYGGEEFAVILPETTLDGALTYADKVKRLIHEAAMAHCHPTIDSIVTLSMGAATTTPAEGDSSTNLMADADRFLYIAKQQGRDRAICVIDMENS